jgi:hypothetical protein
MRVWSVTTPDLGILILATMLIAVALPNDAASTDPSTGFPMVGNPGKENLMRGYVARKGDRWYAVVYEGLDPVTGKERRRWHPAGTSRAEAEKLAARLAAEINGRNDKVRSLTFGAYLTNTWLPGKRITLAESTWDGYRRKIDRHIIPAVGHARIRRLRAHHLSWKRSTTGCSTRPTVTGLWRRRLCWRLTS